MDMKILDITAIVLTFNEELHIKRCLDNIAPYVQKVYIIDSYSTDKTLDIAATFENVTILQNKWENNYAKQFNWGLEHANIKTAWVLRLDADEYLLPELVEELDERLEVLNEEISGVVFKRRHYFMGKWMKRGIYPVKLLRLFRYRKGICEQRLMDEHIQLLSGKSIEFQNDFVDSNLNDLSWFCHKHVNYAIREAVDLLDIQYGLTGAALNDVDRRINQQAQSKRSLKHRYAQQPLFLRSFFYFCYRYFFRGACFDGKVGFLWTFLQGWWYRMLVDAKIFEIKQACGEDPLKMKKYLSEHYGIIL